MSRRSDVAVCVCVCVCVCVVGGNGCRKQFAVVSLVLGHRAARLRSRTADHSPTQRAGHRRDPPSARTTETTHLLRAAC